MTTAGFQLLRMQENGSSNPPVVTGICDLNKSRARHRSSLKLGSRLKYLNLLLLLPAKTSGKLKSNEGLTKTSYLARLDVVICVNNRENVLVTATGREPTTT